MLIPSENIDKFWHFHTGRMKNYRAMVTSTFQFHFPHECILKVSLPSEYMSVYSKTLDFYRQVFMTEPPNDIWDIASSKIQASQVNFRFINIYRMVMMISL